MIFSDEISIVPGIEGDRLYIKCDAPESIKIDRVLWKKDSDDETFTDSPNRITRKTQWYQHNNFSDNKSVCVFTNIAFTGCVLNT